MLWTRINGGEARVCPLALLVPALDLEALAVEIAQFFDNLPVAEGIGAKLRRMLHGFLETEAEQAADLGLDPTPLLAVVSDVLRIYADALERPDAADS